MKVNTADGPGPLKSCMEQSVHLRKISSALGAQICEAEKQKLQLHLKLQQMECKMTKYNSSNVL